MSAELPVDEQKCGNCRFWKANNPQPSYNLDKDGKCCPHEDDFLGKCRKRPPQFLSSVLQLSLLEMQEDHEADESNKFRFDMLEEPIKEADFSWFWKQPATDATDWCGEWVAK